MGKIITYGLLAALFFSSTFAINRWLNVVEGGHWYWTASLRYIYVFVFMSLLIVLKNGYNTLKETIKCFFHFWYFWLIAGGIGFGLFYLCLCYAASFSSGWVLATTWQTTILFTPLVLLIFRNKVEFKGIIYLLIMFIGVILVNLDEFKNFKEIDLKSIIPIVFAAFFYPLGNTMVKYASEGKLNKFPVNKYIVTKNVSSQILLMTMGALPILFIGWLIFLPPAPKFTQVYSVAFIALTTGIIATLFLYKARQLSENSHLALTAADGTQALEAPLALFWGFILFGENIPSLKGWFGLALVTLGIFLFYRTKVSLNK